MKRPNDGNPDGAARDFDGGPRTYDPEEVVERRYDRPDAGPVTETVVLALAEAANADPLDLTPVGETINTDALDDIFCPAARSAMLAFEHDGYRVKVSGEGRVVVAPKR